MLTLSNESDPSVHRLCRWLVYGSHLIGLGAGMPQAFLFLQRNWIRVASSYALLCTTDWLWIGPTQWRLERTLFIWNIPHSRLGTGIDVETGSNLNSSRRIRRERNTYPMAMELPWNVVQGMHWVCIAGIFYKALTVNPSLHVRLSWSSFWMATLGLLVVLLPRMWSCTWHQHMSNLCST